MSGFIVKKPQEQAFYNASKAAVITSPVARGGVGCPWVRVNAVRTTYINTPLDAFVFDKPKMYEAWIGGTLMDRMGEVSEIASVVLFLAGNAASLINRQRRGGRRRYTCW